ncbi:benzaldehyde dehydrogenase (NAD(+)) [Phtheirospermum japonicum]|uniref:indole-3-acetaldehyde oxidase n=1 Tax=Phtheirospermum japonicum TaxID=374723 RepID=A0A830B7M7_9LAMI|nr:benzaldehyde dehydrogenase (NAD(+)) [Phtheirospermum japonicum]
MDTQTALAIPDEDNCMVVYSSSQDPEYAHRVIARCLGVPEHNVCVLTRRVGGGFGGKSIKSMPFATACALAAHKLCRPVRIYLDQKMDMVIAGGRHPMKITYIVGVSSFFFFLIRYQKVLRWESKQCLGDLQVWFLHF